LSDYTIQTLSIADPDLAAWLKAQLDRKKIPPGREDLARAVQEIIWGLSVEGSFGKAVARGYADLAPGTDLPQIARYFDLVKEAGENGPTLGKIMAVALVPVLKQGDPLFLDRFLNTTRTMLSKGSYTLQDPLNTLSSLLILGDDASGAAFLDLLEETFSNALTYNRSKQLSNHLSRVVLSFSRERAAWQISELRRVIETDVRLTEPFVESLGKGLDLLDREALELFVSKGLERYRQDQTLGRKFLSLESKLGIDTYLDLQRTASLFQDMPRLSRYLRARTGLSLAVRPLSILPGALRTEGGSEPLALSDGKFIYLPDEVGMFPVKEENKTFYKVLLGLEAGYYEFHTFDSDLQKFLAQHPGVNPFPAIEKNGGTAERSPRDRSDLESFFRFFPNSGLSSDLFTLFEHGRIRTLLRIFYPGFFKMALPFLEEAVRTMIKEKKGAGPLFALYTRIAIGPMPEIDSLANDPGHLIEEVADLFKEKIEQDPGVDTCAELVFCSYQKMADLTGKNAASGSALQTPFNRKPRPDLFLGSFQEYDRMARKIVHQIRQQGLTAYGSDIRKHLIAHGGTISTDEISTIVLHAQNRDRSGGGVGQRPADLSFLDLSGILGDSTGMAMLEKGGDFPIFRYHEWDTHLGDFLKDHVLVREKPITGIADDFFVRALNRHKGLVKKIRYSFELLKPEGLIILRKWLEGDEFDYRELLNFAVDKKSRHHAVRTPVYQASQKGSGCLCPASRGSLPVYGKQGGRHGQNCS